MSRHYKLSRRSSMMALLMTLTLLLTFMSGVVSVGAQAPVVSPEVIHTGTGPTGYEVTFRYYDPTATSVYLRGEWFFSDAAHTTTTSSAGWLPSQWIPGAFPIAFPNRGAAANWPVINMVLDPGTGIWSYTTPMPSGTYTYGFYRNCPNPFPSLSGCPEFSDPSNPPWNTTGSIEPTSQVYVPSDAAFGTPDMSWEAPAPNRVAGTLVDVTYASPQSTNPVGFHYLAVYLPPGYDANRSIPYPTLYLSHGGGGNEIDWSTQGVANRIVDNLIASRTIQPMVVAMTNFNGIPGGSPGYRNDLINNVIPYVEANYNVSHNANDRAFAGLSLGGQRANDLLFNATTTFGYLASWSIGSSGAPNITSPLWDNPDLKTRLGVIIGGGNFDSLTVPGIDTYEGNLTAKGIPFVDDRMDAGHEWYTWRQLLYNFAANMAFKHTTTTLGQVAAPGSSDQRAVVFVRAMVTADSTEPARPTGQVQFYLDGQLLDPAMPVLPDGTAKVALPRLSAGQHTVTAIYSGDNFYNMSTSESLAVVR